MVNIPQGHYTDMEVIDFLHESDLKIMMRAFKIRTFAQYKAVGKRLQTSLVHRGMTLADIEDILGKCARGFYDNKDSSIRP
jgi:hypothetical protein